MGIFRNGYENVAFSMPGGEAPDKPRSRPIDLAHLAVQTVGDRQVEREVLGLFMEQAHTFLRRIDEADIEARLFLAHALKGTARNVGAFPIASCVEAVEQNPMDPAVISHLERLIGEAGDFIASIDR